MVFIIQPKEEGEKKDCPSCGNPLIARLKEYKDFPNKIQWQNEKDTNAHYDKDGSCKGVTTSGTFNVKETVVQSTVSEEAIQVDLDYFEEERKNKISDKAILLWNIRLQVEFTIKTLEANPNGGMVWEMTKIIYHELYGDKKN